MNGNNIVMDRCLFSADWTANSNETTTIATATGSPFESNCVSFAKVDGAATTAYGLVYKLVPSLAVINAAISDKLYWSVYASALTNITAAAIRLGTDASNYCEWRFAVAGMTAASWSACSATVGNAYVTGTGCDFLDITYIGTGILFDNEARTLAGIKISRIELSPGL